MNYTTLVVKIGRIITSNFVVGKKSPERVVKQPFMIGWQALGISQSNL